MRQRRTVPAVGDWAWRGALAKNTKSVVIQKKVPVRHRGVVIQSGLCQSRTFFVLRFRVPAAAQLRGAFRGLFVAEEEDNDLEESVIGASGGLWQV